MVSASAEIPGIPAPPVNPTENRSVGKSTSSLGVQQATYNLSKAIFDYTTESFYLDHALQNWESKSVLNSGGDIPKLYKFEARVGASLGLIGYLEKSTLIGGVNSILANSETVKLMEPQLKEHLSEIRDNKVAFQVAAAEYDVLSAELVAPVLKTAQVPKNLGLPVVISSLALENDAYNTAVLAAVLGSTFAPTFHVFDGVRGSHQSSTPAAPVAGVSSVDISRLPGTTNTVLRGFKAANELLGTKLQPFEYYGPESPSTVYVTAGEPNILALKDYSKEVGVVNVRLYSPFLTEEFLSVLPKSVTNLFVSGDELYKDVNLNLKVYFGFKGGPAVQKVNSEIEISKQPGFQIKIWDSDRACTASAPARLANPVPEANVYSKFDNFVAGGIVQSDLRFNFTNQWWDIEEADAVVVNDPSILKSVDVTATCKQGGTLVIAAIGDESLTKLIPAQLKLNIMSKQLKVYSVDYSVIDKQNTQGRTLSMAVQGLLWHLSGADLDTATSRVVHANSLDTELIAATVNKIITTLLEKSLKEVKPETLEEWKHVEVSEKEQHIVYVKKAVATSFVPTGRLLDEDFKDAAVTQATSLQVKQRLVFKEAFEERMELRPEVPAKTFIAKVKRNQRVTPDSYDRNIFQLELDISGTGLTYAIGEALGVHAPNNEELVADFLDFYGVNKDEVFGVDLAEGKMYRTAFQLGRDYLDFFGKAPKRFYESLSHFAKDEKEQQHLARLGSGEGAAELKIRNEEDFQNYVDVLHEFKSARPSFAELIELVSPLKRREYSIASSQKVHPNEVHLLVVVVDWTTKSGQKRFGQCSKYLSSLPHGAEVVVSVKPSVMKLPKDPKTPVIMAGLGTGLAPFKAFLEEKMYQRDQGEEIGPIYLFMGSRHQREEYLYGELFEAYKAANVLTHIGAAFSRDQPEKIYIQHRIQQQKEALADAFVEKKGNFYLCGPTWPVPDISAALTEIVLEGAKRDGTQVNEETLIEDLKEAERYILEVY